MTKLENADSKVTNGPVRQLQWQSWTAKVGQLESRMTQLEDDTTKLKGEGKIDARPLRDRTVVQVETAEKMIEYEPEAKEADKVVRIKSDDSKGNGTQSERCSWIAKPVRRDPTWVQKFGIWT